MNVSTFNKKLFNFLAQSTSPFHTAAAISDIFLRAGFVQLNESDNLPREEGQPHFIVRDCGSVVAYNFGSKKRQGFRILGSHSDSPCLQIKPKPDLFDKNYHRLGVEVYGGALLNPWFDRELSISGRINYLSKTNEIASTLLDLKSPVGIIPSLAIHLDRNANTEKSINPQKDITPIVGLLAPNAKTGFEQLLKKSLKKSAPSILVDEILSYDLFFYDYHSPGYAGFQNEFIVSSRLDNLLSCFVTASAIAKSDKKNSFMFICNNHEEVGSNTASGAQGNLLQSVFERLIPDNQERFAQLSRSFLISVDNAHAVHPNFPDKHEPSHDIHLNTGPVLKINANHRYASSSPSNSIFKVLCRETGHKEQEFVMRNDLACGSTIGPITAAKLGIRTVDIGAATLAMHSIREMTGKRDPQIMYEVIQHFLNRKNIPEIIPCD